MSDIQILDLGVELALIVTNYRPEPELSGSYFRVSKGTTNLRPDETVVHKGQLTLQYAPDPHTQQIVPGETCALFIGDQPLQPVKVSSEREWDLNPITRTSMREFSSIEPLLHRIRSGRGELHLTNPDFRALVLFFLETDDVAKILPPRTTFMTSRSLNLVPGEPIVLESTSNATTFTLRRTGQVLEGVQQLEFHTDRLLMTALVPDNLDGGITVLIGKWADGVPRRHWVGVIQQLCVLLFTAAGNSVWLDREITYVADAEDYSKIVQGYITQESEV